MTVGDIFTIIAAILTLWVTVKSAILNKRAGLWDNKSRGFASKVGEI